MKPFDLLNAVKEQFKPLYIDDSGVLKKLLDQTLRAYRDKAGVLARVETVDEAETVAVPDDFQTLVCAEDSKGRWHKCAKVDDVFTIVTDTNSVAPYTFTYFVDLTRIDFTEGELPTETHALLMDHLTALIDVQNTKRARAAAQATGRQAEFPMDQELRERVTQVELEMDEAKAIIPMAAVF